jgi:hypothetical protein
LKVHSPVIFSWTKQIHFFCFLHLHCSIRTKKLINLKVRKLSISPLEYNLGGQNRLLEPIGHVTYFMFRLRSGSLELLYSLLDAIHAILFIIVAENQWGLLICKTDEHQIYLLMTRLTAFFWKPRLFMTEYQRDTVSFCFYGTILVFTGFFWYT